MEILTYTVTPEEDGVCVRHILKAKLHFSIPRCGPAHPG